MIQASTIQNSHHGSQCAWTYGFRWLAILTVLRPPDSHGSSVIFLFVKHVSTPFSSPSWNSASWARFSIKYLQLDGITYAPGSDIWWATDSFCRTHWSIQAHVTGIQNSGCPSERRSHKQVDMVKKKKDLCWHSTGKITFIKIVDNGHCIIVEKILRWLWLLHATSSPQGVTINTQWQGPPEFFLWTSCMYCPFVQPMSLAKDKQDFRVGSPDDFNRNIRPTWKKLRQPCLGLIFPEFVSQLKTFTYHPGWFKLEILFINSGQVPSSAIDVTPLIQINVKCALLIMGQ